LAGFESDGVVKVDVFEVGYVPFMIDSRILACLESFHSRFDVIVGFGWVWFGDCMDALVWITQVRPASHTLIPSV
jgi:hypothetical protein